MLVTIDWHSTYRYDPPVRLLNMELHVVPADGGGQQVIDSALTVTPPGPAHAHPHADAFGNTMHSVSLLGPLERMSVSLRAHVRTAEGPSVAPSETPLLRALALAPTRRAPLDDPRLRALAAAAGEPSDPLAFADRLVALIADRFEYVVGHTGVEDTALDFLDHGRGVCQDYAHLMLSLLRSSGVPALYVSGYLAPDSGVAEADTSHAWVRVYAGRAWHGFDPANRGREDERHVVIAVGRDYDDVAPVRGSYRGVTEESWATTVNIETHEDMQSQQTQ